MQRFVVVLALAAAGALFGSSADAAVFSYQFPLNGTQAGTGSPGTGFADVTLDDVAKSVSVDLTYSGLGSPTTNAHIHCCAAPGVNAGVVIPFIPAGFVTGVTSGSFSTTFSNVSDANLAGIEAGLAYINIHTVQFPGGEIRGQIVAVPEPSSLALLALGLAGLVASVRRKR